MRTDAEVTAAAERTADLALRCAALTRQVEALEGQVAALEGVEADRWDEGWHAACIALCPYPPDDDRRLWWVVEHIPKDNPYRAALDPDPADRGTQEEEA